MKVWIVTHQLPKNRVVGVYLSEHLAKKHYDMLTEKECPLYYPCDVDMLEEQNGYNKNLNVYS